MGERFAGVDWGSQRHAACVVQLDGSVCRELLVDHDAAGMEQLCRELQATGAHSVAIERPDGVVVNRLVQAGFEVVPVHPNVVKATRSRYRSHGGQE